MQAMTLTMTILTNEPMTIMIMVIMVMLKTKTTLIQTIIMMAVKLVDPIMRTMKTSVPKTTKYQPLKLGKYQIP